MVISEPVAVCSDVQAGDVRRQLECMLASGVFRRSPRLSRLLRHIVEQSLRGEDYRIKEYSIGVEVFGRPDAFDPRIDSVVRVAVRQLRAKLEHYYGTEGRLDPVLIRFQPGDYTPRIRVRSLNSNTTVCPATDVLIVDGDRAGAHAVAECLDPAMCRIVGVTNNSNRAIALADRAHPAVVVIGVSVCGGMIGCELMQAIRHDHTAGIVAVMSTAVTDALIEDVIACDPDAVVFKPLRKADVETAIRAAVISAELRKLTSRGDRAYAPAA